MSLTQTTKQPQEKREPEFISLTTLNKDRLSPISCLPRTTQRISLKATHGVQPQSSTETSGIGTALSSFDMSFEFEHDDARSPKTPERDRRRISPRRAESYDNPSADLRKLPPRRSDSCEYPNQAKSPPHRKMEIGPPEFLNQSSIDNARSIERRNSPSRPDFFYNPPRIIHTSASCETPEDEGIITRETPEDQHESGHTAKEFSPDNPEHRRRYERNEKYDKERRVPLRMHERSRPEPRGNAGAGATPDRYHSGPRSRGPPEQYTRLPQTDDNTREFQRQADEQKARLQRDERRPQRENNQGNTTTSTRRSGSQSAGSESASPKRARDRFEPSTAGISGTEIARPSRQPARGAEFISEDVITELSETMMDNKGFLNVQDEDPTLMDYSEWDHKFNRRRSSRSPSPCRSPRLSRSGSIQDLRRKSKNFLADPQSTWVKWSQARRNSFQNRIKMMEDREKHAKKNNLTLPIKKARKESSRFLNPEEEVISDVEDIAPPKPKKTKKKPDKKEPVAAAPRKKIKLTEGQWQVLMDYWENQYFIISRYVGIIFALIAVGLGAGSLGTDYWADFQALNGRDKATVGLFIVCDTENKTLPNSSVIQFGNLECRTDFRFTWQKAVIGLLCFAVGVGFLATILSICGLCVHNLPKKLYYYHSAGEIFFVCALSSTLALIAYPTCMEKESGLLDQRYGYSYAIGWGSTAFFFAASFCMMLDDMIHSASTRGCCFCCKRKKKDGDTQNV